MHVGLDFRTRISDVSFHIGLHDRFEPLVQLRKVPHLCNIADLMLNPAKEAVVLPCEQLLRLPNANIRSCRESPLSARSAGASWPLRAEIYLKP